MLHRPAATRAALLAMCLLSACAAADPADVPGPASRPLAGTSGDILAGRFALGQADVATAADDLLHALQAGPPDEELKQQAFAAAVLTGRPEALALAHELTGSPAAMLVVADAALKAGDWRGAEAAFAKLPSRGPTEILQPLLRAWAQQGAGATDEALNTLRPFIDGTRYRGVFALHAAMICDQADRKADAARLYRLALVEYGALNLRLGTIVASWQARSGHESEARATIHATALANPSLSLAEPALQQAVGTTKVTTAADGVAEAYLAMAATLQQQNANEFALLLLRLALDLRQDFTAARLLASEVQAANGQAAAAITLLGAVPADDPLIAVVRLRQAQYAEREGHMAEAQQQLEQLAEAYPQRPEPLVMLANMQRVQSRFAEAVDTYTRALDRVPQPAEANWALFYQRGMSYDRAHEWPRAEADLLRALDLSPNQPAVLNYLAYAWAEQGRNLARARQMIDRAVEQRPNDGSIVDSLGWVLLRQGDREGAIRFLERAVELQPEDATINGHLGDAYMAAGRRGEAQVQWRRALILNPDPQDVPALQAKLAGADSPPAVSSAGPPAVSSAGPPAAGTAEHRVE